MLDDDDEELDDDYIDEELDDDLIDKEKADKGKSVRQVWSEKKKKRLVTKFSCDSELLDRFV